MIFKIYLGIGEMTGGDSVYFLVSFESNLKRIQWTWLFNPSGLEQEFTKFI